MLLLQFISKLLKPQSWKFGFGTIAPRYKLCWCCWSCIELNYRNQINSLYRGATSYNYGAETSSGAGDWDRPHSLSGLISHYQISGHRFQSNLSHQIPVRGEVRGIWVVVSVGALWSHLQGCGYLRSEYCISGFGLVVWIIWLKYHTTVQYQ